MRCHLLNHRRLCFQSEVHLGVLGQAQLSVGDGFGAEAGGAHNTLLVFALHAQQ